MATLEPHEIAIREQIRLLEAEILRRFKEIEPLIVQKNQLVSQLKS